MNVFRMYNLEREVILERDNSDPGNVIISILGIVNDGDKRLKDDYDYVKSSILIPYKEMLHHINFYRESFQKGEMDEAYEITFIQDLSKRYNLEPNLVVKRFKWVDKLSKSLIFSKKLEELYNPVEKRQGKVKSRNNKDVRKIN